MKQSKAAMLTALLLLLMLQMDHYASLSLEQNSFDMRKELSVDKVKDIDCGEECTRRCSKADRHNMCIRACNTCCARCQCVPPGTSGNRDVCPCYAKMKTHEGKYKCP
ncbi:cypmaclein-like [Nymphaea colorata]|nr:cypmaclein-like [Nymphaea colorata]